MDVAFSLFVAALLAPVSEAAAEPSEPDTEARAEPVDAVDVVPSPQAEADGEEDAQPAPTNDATETAAPPQEVAAGPTEPQPVPEEQHLAEPTDEPLPPARDFEQAPLAREKDASEEDDEYWRRGGFISFAGGLGHCGGSCSYLPVIGGARFEAGYRWGHLALGASVSLAGAKYSTAQSEPDDIYFTSDETGRVQFFQLNPFVQLFLAKTGRVDPYLHLGLGYHRFTRASRFDGGNGASDWKYTASAPAVTVGGGVPFFVTERIQLGGRFDKVIAFAGKICRTIDGSAIDGEPECRSNAEETQDYNTIDRRFDRLARPRPWTVSFELRVAF